MAEKQPKQQVKKAVDGRDQKIRELTETLQRLQAEFENYKKRVEREKLEFMECANKDLILNMLPVLDSFELALKNEQNSGEFVKGVKLIYAQLYSMLESMGLKRIKTVGEKFDPYRHEVMLQENSDKEEGVIIEELQKGYMLGSRVIRHSKVKISNGG
jgi:molecular chaperone GrpE